MRTDLKQNWIQWNAIGPTDSDWCRMSPRLSPWKMRLAKDLPCEQYNVSPCIGDSVQGTAEIWTSPQLEVYISIAILQNMCFGACWEKGFIFSSVQTKVTQLYYVAGFFFSFLFSLAQPNFCIIIITTSVIIGFQDRSNTHSGCRPSPPAASLPSFPWRISVVWSRQDDPAQTGWDVICRFVPSACHQ